MHVAVEEQGSSEVLDLQRESSARALEESIARRQERTAYKFFLRRKMAGMLGGAPWRPRKHLSLTALKQPSNTSGQPANTTDQPANANLQEIFERHNQYRCMHGVPPLKWNNALAESSAKWGKESGGRMVHSSDQFRTNVAGFKLVGENLAWGTSRFTSKGAVDEWHKEIKFTNNGTTSTFNYQAGHYTALVWKSTTDMGCAVYQKLLVCQMGPIGNTKTLFEENVLPITKSATECGAYGYKRGMIRDEVQDDTPYHLLDGKSMQGIIAKFIDEQSDSEDYCHSQILEAKHHMNQIEWVVEDTFNEINGLENQTEVSDTVLQEKLQELTNLDNWRDKELAKCRKQKEEAVIMYTKLKKEMKEMKQIASPGVSMDVATGKLQKAALVQEDTLKSHNKRVRDVTRNRHLTTAIEFSGNQARESMSPTPHVHSAAPLAHPNVGNAEVLVKAVHKASLSFQSCVHASEVLRSSLIEKPEKTTEECEAEKEELHQVYVKAYVELSRELKFYDELANSTACFDSIEDQYASRKQPLDEEADSLTSEVSFCNTELQELRPQLEDAKKAEDRLKKHVSTLVWECGAVAPTASDLDKVREAIHALSLCPGLSRVKFSLPRWTGNWTSFRQDATVQDDAAQDKAMNDACKTLAPGSRAAEVDELQERTIEGIPESNSAPNPLIGSCPNCQGRADELFQSGHARVCWDRGMPLTLAKRSESCGTGKKAILCVIDQNLQKTA